MRKAKDRIVIDTNLWIHFLLSKDYTKLDKLLNNNKIAVLYSSELLEELIEVAQRPKFKKYFSTSDISTLLNAILMKAEFIEVTSEVNLCRDSKDDFLLALAMDGKANHLVTGDKDLLEIKQFGETVIITMTAYLEGR